MTNDKTKKFIYIPHNIVNIGSNVTHVRTVIFCANYGADEKRKRRDAESGREEKKCSQVLFCTWLTKIKIQLRSYKPSGFAHFRFSILFVFGHRISCQERGCIVAPASLVANITPKSLRAVVT